MTKPGGLLLIPLDIPVEHGVVVKNADTEIAENHRLGLDQRGNLYLIYRHTWPSIQANRPRLSVSDPHWSAHHGLRYIEWVI